MSWNPQLAALASVYCSNHHYVCRCAVADRSQKVVEFPSGLAFQHGVGFHEEQNNAVADIGPVDSSVSIYPMLPALREVHLPDTAGSPDLAALMVRIDRADQVALGQLYDATVAQIYARALRITGSRVDAEEVTCDVYQHLWHNARRFDPKHGSPVQLLMVMARSRALDRCRNRVRRERFYMSGTSEVHETDPALEQVRYPAEHSVLRAALLQLKPLQAQLIGLAFFDELSHREIADSTNLPLGTVKSHLCRALVALRQAFAGVDRVTVELPTRQAPNTRHDFTAAVATRGFEGVSMPTTAPPTAA